MVLHPHPVDRAIIAGRGAGYMLENASYLQGQTVSMANDLERNRAMFYWTARASSS